MKQISFDLETDGFLDVLTKIHCVAMTDLETGKHYAFHDNPKFKPRDGSVNEGLDIIEQADLIVGHNIVKFDIPAIQKVRPGFSPKGKVRDTLICSQLLWPRDVLIRRDWKNIRKGMNLPKKHAGNHSLEAWGYRLINYKGDFDGEWDKFTQKMLTYSIQDDNVTEQLWRTILKKKPSEEAVQIEHDLTRICERQTAYGFAFDEEKATKLYATLCGLRAEAFEKVAPFFPDKFKGTGIFKPKRTQRRKVPGWNHKELITKYQKVMDPDMGVEIREGAFTKVELVKFNPGSGDQLAERLIETYGWQPTDFTDKGKPSTKEEHLKHLKYPCIEPLLDWLLLNKRALQVAEGPEAWLKKVENGRIHGKVKVLGPVTGRMSHYGPNLSQVPSVDSEWGTECRECFIVTPDSGKVLVGIDASGLELRELANYLAKWDGGAYAKEVEEGDAHTTNAEMLGLERDKAKTFIYGLLYGAGNAKLGRISDKGPAHGKKMRARFFEGRPAFAELKKSIDDAYQHRGWVYGPDGRKIYIRSQHSALNTLLQGSGAIVMKKACQMLDARLIEKGLVPGKNYEFVINSHDEWQIECDKKHAKTVAKTGEQAIVDAGKYFKQHVALAAESKVGMNWAETH